MESTDRGIGEPVLAADPCAGLEPERAAALLAAAAKIDTEALAAALDAHRPEVNLLLDRAGVDR